MMPKVQKLLFSTLTIVFILPFIALCFYLFPQADDLCRVLEDGGDYFSLVADFYMHHNGRFINALTSFLPVYHPSIYRWTPILGFIFMYYSFAALFSSWGQIYAWKEDKKAPFIAAIIAFALLVVGLPTQNEFFYWYAVLSAYVLSIGANNFIIAHLLKHSYGQEEKKTPVLLTSLLIILSIGSHEIGMALVDFSLFLFFVHSFIQKRQNLTKAVILNAVGVIASCLVVFSPGTAQRSNNRHVELLSNLEGALVESTFFILENTASLSLFMSIVFMLSYVVRNISKEKLASIKVFHPVKLFLLSTLYVIIPHFIYFYALGLNDNYQALVGRPANFAFATFLMVALFNTVNLAFYLGQKQSIAKFLKNRALYYASFSLMVLGMFTSHNYRETLRVLYSGEAAEYKQAMEERFLALAADDVEGKRISVKEFNKPRIFVFGHFVSEPYQWENTCFVYTAKLLFGGKAESMVEYKEVKENLPSATQVTYPQDWVADSTQNKEVITLSPSNAYHTIFNNSLQDSSLLNQPINVLISFEYYGSKDAQKGLLFVSDNEKNYKEKKWDGIVIHDTEQRAVEQWHRVEVSYTFEKALTKDDILNFYLWVSENASFQVRNITFSFK